VQESGSLGDFVGRHGLDVVDGLVDGCHLAVIEQATAGTHRHELGAVGSDDELAAVLLLVSVQSALGQQVLTQAAGDALYHAQARAHVVGVTTQVDFHPAAVAEHRQGGLHGIDITTASAPARRCGKCGYRR